MKKDVLTNGKIFWNDAQSFIHHYIPDIRKLSINTEAAYRDSMNSYISFLEDEKGIERRKICYNDFAEAVVKEYQDWLLNVKRLAPKTCNLRLTALRSFLEYADHEHTGLTALYVGICDIKDTKVPDSTIEYFEKSQMKAILATPDIKSKIGRRNQMILILMYDSGARVSEILELTVSSLHLKADVPYITIHGKGDKYRNVPLMSKTCRHLLRYLCEFHDRADQNRPLFYATTHGIVHTLSADTLEQLIKKSASKVRETGIDMPKSCHCHMIRKTRAMDLYQSGVPLAHIQQLLGHENISTTSGFYAFATLDTLAKAMKKAEIEEQAQEKKKWKDKKMLQKLYSL